MDKTLPDDSRNPREEVGKEDQTITCLFFFWGQFKYPVVVLTISVGRIIIWGEFPRYGRAWRKNRKGIVVENPPEHSRLFGYMDTRAWGEASTWHFKIVYAQMETAFLVF